jgi:hypothetical protein
MEVVMREATVRLGRRGASRLLAQIQYEGNSTPFRAPQAILSSVKPARFIFSNGRSRSPANLELGVESMEEYGRLGGKDRRPHL